MLAGVPAGITGLREVQVAARRHVSGPNTITAGRATLLWVFLRQFASPFDALLVAVGALALALHERTDALIVLSIVALSVLLGTRNEYRAEGIIEGLRARISRKVTVVRENGLQRVDASELVPGDVVALDTGDAVPADLEIRFAQQLECDEGTLTGESRPVEKETGSIAYMGTSVFAGRGFGVVVAIGRVTRFGEIAAHAARRQPRTAFEIGLGRFSGMLLYITVLVSGAVFAVSLVLHRSAIESLLFALAISVSLTPQMLPVIVSVSLSLGGYRMAQLGAIVKRLISIEDIGNIEVLFTDKTGTLTTGELALEAAVDANGHASDSVRLYGLLCNTAQPGVDSTTTVSALDLALWSAVPASVSARLANCERLQEIPFDYQRRRMSVLASVDKQRLLVVKGAPEAVFACCAAVPNEATALVNGYVESGARVIAVAIRPFPDQHQFTVQDERDLQFAGLLVFADPPKEGVTDALDLLAKLNVQTKVITGDSEQAARVLCSRIGLPLRSSIVGEELDSLNDAELLARMPTIDLFARISPVQKERIIRVQRAPGTDVGFLGDGVNDVLALRTADVGITVDSAADVAKNASDVVLVSKDLAILASGVSEGRRIFANTIKYVLMATSSNFGNMISAAVGSMILPFLPLLPSQVLLNNLLYDVSETTIPSDNVDPEQLVRPSHWDLRFVRRFMAAFGPYSALTDFAIFAILLLIVHASAPVFRAGFFIESFGTQALIVFVLRTRRVPFFSSRPSWQLAVTTALCAAIGMALPFTPIAGLLGFAPVPLPVLGIIAAIVIVYVALAELTKTLFFHRLHARLLITAQTAS
ncbi:MAG TPA: magnesium-translocating P-type ATPase [Candidatus Rubrimentiphilum sp.]|nr:magnesium-translocating P-type ATPase [Candidatus Rubrimentiphilum sp.]